MYSYGEDDVPEREMSGSPGSEGPGVETPEPDVSGPEEAGPTELAEVLAGVEAAVDGLAGVELSACEGPELGAALVALAREQQRLAGVQARLAAAFDTSRAWSDDGARSAGRWLAHHAGLPGGEANGTVLLGRTLRLMPQVAAALGAGEIAAAHARVLGKLARNRRTAEVFARDEALLVGYARDMEWRHFEQAVAYWRQCADPDGVEGDAAADEEHRRVHLSEGLDGTGVLDGRLTAVGHATVRSALDRVYDDLFQQDWAAARDALGREPTVEELARTPAQRRHDALVEMARRSVTAPRDGRRPAPLVSVLVGYETLAGRICQLGTTNTVVTPGTVTRLVDDHSEGGVLLERVVFDTPSRVTDISEQRLFTGGLRRMVQVRDRECTAPGCDVPAERCQIDHVIPWSQGGRTTEANGQASCGADNRRKGTRPNDRSDRGHSHGPGPGPARQRRGATDPSRPPGHEGGDDAADEEPPEQAA